MMEHSNKPNIKDDDSDITDDPELTVFNSLKELKLDNIKPDELTALFEGIDSNYEVFFIACEELS